MIGYVTMGMAVVPMIGPAIGGVLDQVLGWKANFWALFSWRGGLSGSHGRSGRDRAASGAACRSNSANTPSF